MRYTEQRTPNMTGNTAGYRHDERYGRAVNHKPRQSPSTSKKSSSSFALPAPSRGVQRRSLPVRNACGELMRGTEKSHGILVTARHCKKHVLA
jgi:hypothetical protein